MADHYNPDFGRQPSGTSMSTGKIVSLLVGIPFALFVVTVGYNVANPISAEERWNRMESACKQEFGYRGEAAVFQCIVTTLNRYGDEIQRDKLNSVYQRSR